MSLADIQSELQSETALSGGFLTTIASEKLIVYLLDVNDDIPRLSASIVMNSDLRVSVSVNKTLVSVDTSDRYQFTSYNDTIADATVASRTLLQVYLCRAIVAVDRTIAAVSPGGHAVISTVGVPSSTFILQLRGRVSAVCGEN